MPRVPRYAWCDSLRGSIVRLMEEKQDSLLKHSRTGRVRSSEVVSRPPALAQVLCSTLAGAGPPGAGVFQQAILPSSDTSLSHY